MKPPYRPILISLVVLAGTACKPGSTTGAEAEPTYHGDIAPIVAQRCGSCHQPGGSGPFDLSNYNSLKAMAEVSLNAIESGRMPPWHPTDDCNNYVFDASMPSEEQTLFRQWVEGGSIEGDESTATPLQEVPEPPPHQLEFQPASPYEPNAELTDDYRCIPVSEALAEETYIRGIRVVPGASELVHHVIVKSVPPEGIADLDAKDAASPGPGYSCFGTELLPGSTFVGGWVPGSRKGIFGPETAYVLPAGSKLVMEIHYNLLAAPAQPDLTRLQLITLPTPPKYQAVNRFLVNTDLRIQPGVAEQRHEVIIPAPTGDDLEIIAVSPHMHLLGTEQRLDLIREDGQSTCLVDIPEWDFDWQRSYGFFPEHRPKLLPGDRFKLSCVYDNTQENQPFINGQRVEPRYVSWGEGTLDEMCLNTLTYRRPYEPESQNEGMSCLEVLMCFDGCTAGDDNCDLQCYLSGRPESRPYIDAFVACYQSQACNDSDCAREHCNEEITACISG